MRTAAVGVVVLLLLVVCSAGGIEEGKIALYGSYEDVPSVGSWPEDASGMVGVGGVEFFVIPDNGGGLTLPVRVEIVDARITEILSAGILGPVCVGDIRGQPTIYVAEHRLVTVYDEDAANAGAASARVLAEKWAKSVAEALPRVVPSPYAPPSMAD